MQKRVRMLDREFLISGDDEYARLLGEEFDHQLTTLMTLLCDENSRAIDIGANIGLTALALSAICKRGPVRAFEPVPRTFRLLAENARQAANIKVYDFGLGKTDGTIPMQGYEDNLSGAFVADLYRIDAQGHFRIDVRLRRLDDVFSELELDRVDFIKIDVEGFELDVLEGGRRVLNEYHPTVLLEMNHWCLNMFRRISIPEFRERLLAIFPVVYAVDGTDYLDFTDPQTAYHISHEHIVRFKFMNLVGGFDRDRVLSRLADLKPPAPAPVNPEELAVKPGNRGVTAVLRAVRSLLQ